MKKFLLFIICLFLSITSVNALDVNFNSKNIILYNYNTDEVIFEEGADEVISIASMTKIMTALVLLENIYDLNTKVVLQDKHFVGLKESDASVAGFRVGQKVTYLDLLYGVLVPSGADAVQALAIEVFGSNTQLVNKMNEKAKSMGLNNTHFVNPYGLDDDGHYSTVREVSIFLKEALKNETFKKIYTTRRYLVSDKSITLYSTIVVPLNTINKSADYIIGSKTGYTYEAGRCLASLGYDKEQDIYYLMVTAGAVKRIDPVIDAINVYEHLFKNYSEHVIIKENEVVKKLKTKYAKEKEIGIKSSEEVNIFLENSSYDTNKLTFDYNIPDKINKILSKDTKIGTLTVKYDGQELKTVELLIEKDMHFSFFRLFLTTILPLSLIAVVCIFIFKKK